MSQTFDLLEPWIDWRFGDEVDDPVQRFDAFQRRLPGELPADYADALLRFERSVALVDDTIIDAIEPAPPRAPNQFMYMADKPGIDCLYGLQSNLANLFRTWEAMHERMPYALVPIGDDGGGNQICIDVSKSGHGRIFGFYNLGFPGPNDADGYPGRGNIFLLATSFTDLIHRFRTSDPLPPGKPRGRICFVRP